MYVNIDTYKNRFFMCTHFQRYKHTYTQSSSFRGEEHSSLFSETDLWAGLKICNLHILKSGLEVFLVKGAKFKLSQAISRRTS